MKAGVTVATKVFVLVEHLVAYSVEHWVASWDVVLVAM
jgi:hypothetical protein